MSQVRETGIVKWFNEKKGFGFIISPEGEDIFVHYKDIQGTGFKTLREQDSVSYVVERGPKGMKAHDVVLLAEAETEMA